MKVQQTTLKQAVGLVLAVNLLSPAIATPARASDLSDLKQEEREKDKEIREKDSEKKDIRKQIAVIQSGGESEDDGASFHGNCDATCRPSAGACKTELFTNLGIQEDRWNQPVPIRRDQACNVLFEMDVKLERIPEPCASAVRSCGDVARKLEVKRLQVRLKELDGELKDLREEKRQIAKDYADAQRACPNCALAEAMKPRDPKLGDYIVGGLQAVTPLALGGLNAWMYNKGVNSYANSYGNYTNAMTTMGLPPMAPGFMYGSAGGGNAGWGSLGAGVLGAGMGAMAGGGVNLGIYGSLGAGSPYGLGYPGLGYGYPGMGYGYGMMGPGVGLNSGVGLNAGVGLGAWPGMSSGMNGAYGMMGPGLGVNAGIYAGMNGGGYNPYAMGPFAAGNYTNTGYNPYGYNPYAGLGVHAGFNLGINSGYNPYSMGPYASGGYSYNPYSYSPYSYSSYSSGSSSYNPYVGVNGGLSAGWGLNSPWGASGSGGYNASAQAYYQSMMQAQMQSQRLQYQRGEQSQENLGTAQEQLWENQVKYQQAASQYSGFAYPGSYGGSGYGNYGYGGYGYGLPGYGVSGGLSGGISIGIGAGARFR